jgi:hypothetical protein
MNFASRAPRSSTIPLLAATVALFFAPLRSSAGTIQFQDLTDTMSVLVSDSSRMSFMCDPNETLGCIVTITEPLGVTLNSVTSPSVNIADPAGDLRSDQLLFRGSGRTFLAIFQSDAEAGQPRCSDVGGCSVIENGTMQLADTVTWSNGTMDTISFQSDASEVPEPSAFIMALTAIPALVFASRRPLKRPRIRG